MAPRKKGEYEQDHTKEVEEETGDDVVHSARGLARSAEDEAKNEVNKVRGRRKRDTIITLGKDGITGRTVPSEGQKTEEVTCTDTALQQSLRTLIENWHTDRKKEYRDWDHVWKEIEDRIQLLSKYISDNKSSMEETYCKKPNGQGTIWTEADSNACMLITAGLKHIYEINIDTGKEGDLAKKNNRIFRQTAACIILNEFIKKLEKKAKSCTQKISIDEGINHAFSKSSEIKETTPCKGDNDCFECKQVDYSDCKMGNEQVRVKLRGKLDSDAKINEELEDIYPPSNPTSTSGTATLTEWFTRFSNNVSEQDNQQYEELGALSALCEHNEDDEEIKKLNLDKYGEFCNIMMKNIMLVTGVPKQYKNEKGKTPCEKKVKNIPLCDLLKVWMWYMHWFCVPKEVIEHVIRGVKEVRAEFIKKGVNYMECAYDAAFKIPHGGKRDMGSEAYDLFGTSTLYHKIEKDTKKTWCENNKWGYRIRAPEDPIKARVDEDEDNRVISSNDNKNNVDEIMDKIEEGLKEEEGGGGGVSKPGRPSTPVGEDCTKKTSLCERANCVTKNWFIDRIGGDSRQNWCAYWGPHDVGNVLTGLSNAMTNENKLDDDLCKDIPGTNGASTEEPNKNACSYIVRGLEYIYKIKKKEVTEKDQGKKARLEKQYENDQQFDRVIGCIFLNAYADRLQQLEQSKCDVQAGITHAFSKSNDIKEQTSPCNSDSKCFECMREENFDCTLSVDKGLWTTNNCPQGKRDNMKKEVDDKLDTSKNGDQKVKQALEAIEKICPKNTDPGRRDTEDQLPKLPAPAPPPAPSDAGGGKGGAATGEAALKAPKAVPLIHKKDNPFLPYLPLAPAVLGISVMSYLLSKYFGMLRKTRKRYRRAYQLRGPTVQEQLLAHVDEDGPREYYIVKERKPRSTPIKRKKKRVPGRRRAGRCRGVRRRMIIDIHLEVLNECQKGDLHSTKEDFFEILVQEFIGNEFIKEDFVPKEQYFGMLGKTRKRYKRAPQLRGPSLEQHIVDHVDQPGPREYYIVKERKPSSTPKKRRKKRSVGRRGGVRRRMIIDIHLELLDEYQKGDLHLTKEDFFAILVQEFMGSELIKEEKVTSLDSGIRVDLPKEQVLCLDSWFREEDFVPRKGVPREDIHK
ncbi:SICA antigen [Plasmodium coatneyi]|uniref:SICA antigen n=1 Tax=Plasmodium coatneyi TaxID=208452 RepID=A0A1B1DUZ8_9APIC|nr:SICA antigen [Plasmodium coatneyi]ANQ06405.1 SICA antigen [Plasmodium coatneyi]